MILMVRRPLPALFFPIVAFAPVVLTTGCDEAKVVVTGLANETENPDYVEGKRLQAEGKNPEALQKFLDVIVSRREAPESHLEAGALCMELKDPLQSLFHYRRFLTLRPDSPQKIVVQQRIRLAEREFLKTLPFVPPEGGADDRIADLMEKLRVARQENDRLKLSLGAKIAERKPVAAAPAAAPAETPAKPEEKPAAAAPARRSYVVVSGDTLGRIAQKVYGNKNRWQEIYNANRNVMRNERDLKAGVTLVIP